jgi:hypothetical protein
MKAPSDDSRKPIAATASRALQVLISELEEFEYEYTRTGVRYSAPEGFYDDYVCALALAVWKKTIPVAGEDWTTFFARQAAKSRLTADWSKVPADIEAAQVDAMLKDGTAEMRTTAGTREWRRKPSV